MKRSAVAVAIAIALAACGSNNSTPTSPSPTGPITFTVQMSAANEVPAVTNSESGGRGTATITFNVTRDATGAVTGGGTANFSVQLTGFPAGSVAILAHIHPGAVGVNGSPLVNTGLSPSAPIVMGDGTGTLTLTNVAVTTEQAQAVVANPAGFYFNVHTSVNPGGAVRGQLVRQ
jgi:hypothetical protein